MNGTIKRQFSFANAWDRLARVGTVGLLWVVANGLPPWSLDSAQAWAALLAAMLGASYTGKPQEPTT